MVQPELDSPGARVRKAELDYLRLIYAVSQIRKQGGNAQGYFVVTDSGMLRRLNQMERAYRGREYATILEVSLNGYLKRAGQAGKTEILSGMVKDAVTEKEDGGAPGIRRRMREFILAETMLDLEPSVQQVKEEDKFPFGIRWHYYGMAVEKSPD